MCNDRLHRGNNQKIGRFYQRKKGGKREMVPKTRKLTNRHKYINIYIYVYQMKNKWFISSIKKIRRLRHTIHCFVI